MNSYRLSSEARALLSMLGFLLFFMGIILTVIGILPQSPKAKVGGLIIVGPFPLILQGELSPILLLILFLLPIILFVVFLLIIQVGRGGKK